MIMIPKKPWRLIIFIAIYLDKGELMLFKSQRRWVVARELLIILFIQERLKAYALNSLLFKKGLWISIESWPALKPMDMNVEGNVRGVEG